MRILAIAAATGLILLAGCENQTEPAAPPTTQDALTTATATPSPTPTSDEVELTTEPEPTAAEPTTQEPVADDGPPEMPEEATEQTDAGAEAFALHYIDLVNYTGRYPTLGLLDPLAKEGCLSCANHEEAVEYAVEYGDHLRDDTFRPGEPTTILTADTARVAVPVEQVAQDFYRGDEAIDRRLGADEAALVIRMDWNAGWLISEITVEQ